MKKAVVQILKSNKDFNPKVIVTDDNVFVSCENAAYLEGMLKSVLNIDNVYLESYSRNEKSFLLTVY